MPARIRSIDIVRGAIMVLMALDHVRVFAAIPAGGPTPALFFTRWVTHFCAPGFVFLAGASAFCYGLKPGAGLTRYLLTRGVLLIGLELFVLRFFWTFNGDVWNYNLAGVIWMLGWCFLTLAVLTWPGQHRGTVPPRVGAIAAFGAVMVLFHNALAGPILGALGAGDGAWWASLLYFGGDFRLFGSGPRIVVLYSLIPWIGLVALGYAFGRTTLVPEADRHRWWWRIGCGAIALFLLLRTFNIYGDPRHWSPNGPPNASPWLPVLSFLNTAKYPASLLFLMMTLGPTIAVMPWLERARGRLFDWLEVFGRVPLFYYVLHIPLIHLTALLVSLLRTGAVSPWLFGNHPMEPDYPPPPDAIWSLPLLYAVTAAVVLALYFPCRWYADLKKRHTHGWLSLL